jgi:hypothetical protein
VPQAWPCGTALTDPEAQRRDALAERLFDAQR